MGNFQGTGLWGLSKVPEYGADHRYLFMRLALANSQFLVPGMN